MTANPHCLEGLFVRKSNIHLLGVITQAQRITFSISFMGEIAFNAEMKSTNGILM